MALGKPEPLQLMWRAIRSVTQTHSDCEYLAKAGSSLKLSAKVTDAIAMTCTYGAPLLAAQDTGTGIRFLIDKYGVNGEEFSGQTVLEAASVMMNGMQLGGYTRNLFGGSYVTHAAGNYEDAAAANSGKTLKMDLQFFANGGNTPKNKTSLWGQEKYVTEKGLNTVKQHLSGDLADEFNDAMINRLETAYKNNTKISGADLDFYAHEIYESNMMKNGMSYDNAHEAAKAYYNATEFNFYHPKVIKQNPKLFNNAWFEFWDIERN